MTVLGYRKNAITVD